MPSQSFKLAKEPEVKTVKPCFKQFQSHILHAFSVNFSFMWLQLASCTVQKIDQRRFAQICTRSDSSSSDLGDYDIPVVLRSGEFCELLNISDSGL